MSWFDDKELLSGAELYKKKTDKKKKKKNLYVTNVEK